MHVAVPNPAYHTIHQVGDDLVEEVLAAGDPEPLTSSEQAAAAQEGAQEQGEQGERGEGWGGAGGGAGAGRAR